ncbi:hypothetical protein [Embleya sp. AB8]|uniref:hypothetical protein n=1 Tax=Embleya sp. AB8 TaxID=3156304 RepID=UPI003C746433
MHAHRTPTGNLRFTGHDLNGPEYEYVITVAAADIPTIVRALGGAADADVLELLTRHRTAIVRKGEYTWLGELGITVELWSHREW